MKLAIVIVIAALVSPALAQQQVTPSQMAIQIDNAVNGMASPGEALQAQLQKSQARVK